MNRTRTHSARRGPTMLLTGALALGTLALGATGATGATATEQAGQRRPLLVGGPLRDLQPLVAGPFDGATARALVIVAGSAAGGSAVALQVMDIDPSAVGTTYGAHLHLGPCVEGDPAAALGHYNTDVLAGRTPPEVSPRTEVWLDFTVRGPRHDASPPSARPHEVGALGTAVARVPFRIVPGGRSIVIHALPTDPGSGVAGARLACLPVEW